MSKKKVQVYYAGVPLKRLPKSFKELDEMLRAIQHNVRRSAQDEVLYLQGNQSQRGIARNDVGVNTAAMSTSNISNARQDIVKALADLGQANAKIAYSLMKALEVGK